MPLNYFIEKMNADIKDAFYRIKPACDILMVCPTQETIGKFLAKINEQKTDVVQELQQYLLFPMITHIKSAAIEKKYDLQASIVDAMRIILERITQVSSYEMCMKIETSLIQLILDYNKSGMIAEVPEELKLSVMRCLTLLMLRIDNKIREKMFKTQVPMLAQIIFVSVHLAKLERHRALRLAAIHCVGAHTATHEALTENYRITDPHLEMYTVDMLSSILPGVLAALQDVATCSNNPGHSVVVAAVDAIHRILCLPMQDKFLPKKENVTVRDFAKMIKDKTNPSQEDTEVSTKAKPVAIRSPEWHARAGEKLTLITKSLVPLRAHEHFRVRKELGVFCFRLLVECNTTMQPSVSIALDLLLALSRDEQPEVAQFAAAAIRDYFASLGEATRRDALDNLCDNFFATLSSLPRVLNNIDSARKLSALNVVHGYIEAMCGDTRPQRLTRALSVGANMEALVTALTEAAAAQPRLTKLTRHPTRDVSSPPPTGSPWLHLRHLDTEQLQRRFQAICGALGGADCADLLLDRLLDQMQVSVVNWMVAGPKTPKRLAHRLLATYLEEGVWGAPLESADSEPLSVQDTYDVTVYNPRAWLKDSVPDLYEGAVEWRYTDVSYAGPRPAPRRAPTAGEAHSTLLQCCLLTEGVGVAARCLGEDFQPYMMRTLCMLLERVGSEYEMLHLAGLQALHGVAAAARRGGVADLIQANADYFTHQITVRLKKAWNCPSALQILAVVMEYSDSSIFDCLYGVVQDVLTQSCDNYYERDICAYLQVFHTFVGCVRKWFPEQRPSEPAPRAHVDVLGEVRDLENNEMEAERLLGEREFEEETGKTVQEMIREDLKKKEEDVLDYDDKMAEEKPSAPRHVSAVLSVLRRSVNFVSWSRRSVSLLALRVLRDGLPVLRAHEDDLLPMIHKLWPALAARLAGGDPLAARRALAVLLVVAELAKDFIRARADKEVLPHMYSFLRKSAPQSRLQDAGSAYRAGAAYRLQEEALRALAPLAAELRLADAALSRALAVAELYLSKNQPKPLQALAVEFFKKMLEYDYGSAWLHLRRLCDNRDELRPPPAPLPLAAVRGSPHRPENAEYERNVKLIFEDSIA